MQSLINSAESGSGAPRCDQVRAVLDTLAAAAGLILLSPLLLFAAIAIILEDGFPVLFRQTRVGRNGTYFQMLKFRSMRSGIPGWRITAGDDPRLTRVGRVLRSYKIDELPQLWNVVRGEMSLVGPRPEVPPFVDSSNPSWIAVLKVKPGITDLASLVYRNEEEILVRSSDPEAYYSNVVLPAKLALNLQYIQSRSFWRDLKLIILTLRYSFFPASFEPSRILRSFPSRTSTR